MSNGSWGFTDANQGAIVEALRKAGATVTSLHAVGGGVPDLLVGWVGRTFLLECKTLKGKRNPKAAPLTPAQIVWHQQWRGQVAIVTTPEEALRAVGMIR